VNSPTITIRIEAELLKIMDELVQKRIFRNKSAIVREALIRFLKQYAEINPRMLYLTPEL